jgi:hypothetical protein
MDDCFLPFGFQEKEIGVPLGVLGARSFHWLFHFRLKCCSFSVVAGMAWFGFK